MALPIDEAARRIAARLGCTLAGAADACRAHPELLEEAEQLESPPGIVVPAGDLPVSGVAD